jgi:hypothetical protein
MLRLPWALAAQKLASEVEAAAAWPQGHTIALFVRRVDILLARVLIVVDFAAGIGCGFGRFADVSLGRLLRR